MWVGVVVVCSYRVSVRGWYIFVCISLFCMCVCVCFFKTIWEVFFSSVRAFFFLSVEKRSCEMCFWRSLLWHLAEKNVICACICVLAFSVFGSWEVFQFKHKKWQLFEVNQGCHEGEKRFVCVCTHCFIFYDPIIFGLSKYFYIFSLS